MMMEKIKGWHTRTHILYIIIYNLCVFYVIYLYYFHQVLMITWLIHFHDDDIELLSLVIYGD